MLHSQTIRSFVGNSFHPKLISLAIGTSEHIRAWIQGRADCFFGVAAPDEVRKSYISFKQAIEENLKLKGRNTQVTIVPEPYRHINYRQLVMAPTNKPPVAQPIVAQKLPYYLTKDAVDNAMDERKEKRLDILGKKPLRQFLTDVNLFDYAEQAAVPQWIFVDEEILQALCSLSIPTPALATYQQELLQHRSYHRVVLFLRCLLSTSKNTDTGFIICWLIHQPVHIRYLGPSRVKHLYLLRLRDTLEILLFKYGGESLRIRQPLTPTPLYRSMFGFQTDLHGAGSQHLCAFALQQEHICTVTERPWQHSIVEPGCALWRLSHSLLAAENKVCKEPFANACHHILGKFPIVLIGGLLKDWCLSICPQSARAAHPQIQSDIWNADQAPDLCLLIIHQTAIADTENCANIVTLVPTQRSPPPILPIETAAQQAAAKIPVDVCIDDCHQMTLPSGWYACTQGEISAIIFRRAQALLQIE